MTASQPRIVVTMGDPAGIGPDIILAMAGESFDARVLIIGDPVVLAQRARLLGLKVDIRTVEPNTDVENNPGQLLVIPVSVNTGVEAGVLNPENSAAVIQSIDLATDLCLQGIADAMVTAPVHKAVINNAGISFKGHTEWIAARAGVAKPVMMLANETLRVCLATTHLPLRDVADAITQTELTRTLEIMHRDIGRLYDLARPAIGVCGLNPHAGEGGYLGQEEIQTIEPVIRALNTQGMNLVGPLPADTAFTEHQLASLDAVLAMYHDQGLPVIKHQGFGEVVNVTLGLPLIRTSVDHGTALDLAASGKADPRSLITAIRLAIKFARNKVAQVNP